MVSGTNGLSKKQIAILSPMALAQSSLRNLASLAGLPLTDDLSVWRADQAVLLTTVRKFKRLEADAVVRFDVQEETSVSPLLDVAASRAKHLLTIINFTPDEKLDVGI